MIEAAPFGRLDQMLRTPRRRRILAFDRGGPVWPPRSNAPAGRERNETKKTKNKKDFIKKGLFERGDVMMQLKEACCVTDVLLTDACPD